MVAWWVPSPRLAFPWQTVTSFAPSAGSEGAKEGITPKRDCAAPKMTTVRKGVLHASGGKFDESLLHGFDEIGHAEAGAHVGFGEELWSLCDRWRRHAERIIGGWRDRGKMFPARCPPGDLLMDGKSSFPSTSLRASSRAIESRCGMTICKDPKPRL